MAMFTTVSKNIDFLRWRYGTHEALSERLNGVASSKELSAFANAANAPSEALMRDVESSLKLPAGWCSRDNIALTELSPQDFDLVALVLACKPGLKSSLAALLTSVRDGA